MSHYSRDSGSGSGGSLQVHGRSLVPRAQNPMPPSSPPPPFSPGSPASPYTTVSSSTSSHPSSPVPVSRFSANHQGALLMLHGGAGGAGGANTTLPSPVGAVGSGGKFSLIQRPLAHRAMPHGGGVSFQHKEHPTAVQASHSIGRSSNVNAAFGGAGSNAAGAGEAPNKSKNKENISSDGVRSPAGSNTNNNSNNNSNTNAGNAAAVVGSPKDQSKLSRKSDWYGTFPRLQRGGSAGAILNAAATSGNISTNLDSIPMTTSPLRASPNHSGSSSVTTAAGRSPEPMIAQSTLHARAATAKGERAKVVARTPPHSKKKNNQRRNSDHSVGTVDGHIHEALQDMDIAGDDHEATPTSGYSSDASTFSVESHVSSFPGPGEGVILYGTHYYNSAPVVGPDGVVVHCEDEQELVDASATNDPAQRWPASPLQLRAGAPLPHKMYGYTVSPAPSVIPPHSSSTPHPPALRGNSLSNLTNSNNLNSSTNNTNNSNTNAYSTTTTPIPQLRTSSRMDSTSSELIDANPQFLVKGFNPTTSITPFSSSSSSSSSSTTNFTSASALPSIDTNSDPLLSSPPVLPAQLSLSHTPPLLLNTIPALNLPRSAAAAAAAAAANNSNGKQTMPVPVHVPAIPLSEAMHLLHNSNNSNGEEGNSALLLIPSPHRQLSQDGSSAFSSARTTISTSSLGSSSSSSLLSHSSISAAVFSSSSSHTLSACSSNASLSLNSAASSVLGVGGMALNGSGSGSSLGVTSNSIAGSGVATGNTTDREADEQMSMDWQSTPTTTRSISESNPQQ